jgi:hypothetical protein
MRQVAATYTEFGYPPDMRDAVYYMPPEGSEKAVVGDELVSPILALDQVIAMLESRLTRRAV